MCATNKDFAVCGGKAVFKTSIPIGQLYFPSWEKYESAMRGIFEREYYTNNGPLLTELENRLQDFLNVKHAICVTNGTLGLMMAVEALELTGKVIVPSFTFIASAQALSCTGIEPVLCDIDSTTHQVNTEFLDAVIDSEVTGVMGVNLWGGACEPDSLELYAKKKGISLFFDSAHAFGCEVDGNKIGGFGELEVFSFHATKVLSATEGGCICTNDDTIANRLRAIRPSYGNNSSTSIIKVANARMSEAQAAIALLSLDDFEVNRKNNEKLFNVYDERLRSVPGIKLLKPVGVTFSNYQYVVCEVDQKKFGLNRDQLIKVLEAENIFARRYFYPGVHQSMGYSNSYSIYRNNFPNTDYLCKTLIQLPIGARVDSHSVDTICDVISRVNVNASYLNQFLERSE